VEARNLAVTRTSPRLFDGHQNLAAREESRGCLDTGLQGVQREKAICNEKKLQVPSRSMQER